MEGSSLAPINYTLRNINLIVCFHFKKRGTARPRNNGVSFFLIKSNLRSSREILALLPSDLEQERTGNLRRNPRVGLKTQEQTPLFMVVKQTTLLYILMPTSQTYF